MLKSPHYSYGQPINGINLAIRSALADHVDSSSRIPAEPMACMPGNKENTSSYGGRNSGVIGNGLFVKGRPAAAASSYKFDPNTAINKARSSLASSTYQAHGYLPNFDGASKAHTSSLYHDQTNQPPSPVRVNLPSPAFYGGRQDLRTSSTRQFLGGSSAKKLSAPYHVPVNYGFDGGSDAPVAKNDATCKDKQAEHKDFDYMGVTPDDYETHREDPNNAWHQGAVEDFFQDLAEQESELMSRQRVNTQSAA